MKMNPARQRALSQPPPPTRESSTAGKRQKLSKYERKLAEDEEREAKWEQYRAQKRVESGQLLPQPGSFPLFRPPLPPAKPASSGAANGSSGSQWLSEGEKLALYRSLSYAPGLVPPPSAAFLSLLGREIADFEQSVALSDDERRRKSEVLQRVRDALQPLWPTVDVQPFGSFPLDLSLPHSDVDAVLVIDTKRDVAAELRDVQTVLTCMKHDSMPTFKLIARARVPILRYTDRDRNVKVDLCINATDGVRAVAAMRRYMQHHTEMRPLVLCLKLLMRRAGVSEVYSGGVNSYILQLMVIFFLQMYNMAADEPPKPQNEQQHPHGELDNEGKTRTARTKKRKHGQQSVEAGSLSEAPSQESQESQISAAVSVSGNESSGRLGMLLYSFLDFYGHRFDYVNYGVQLGLPPSDELPSGSSCQYYSKLERGRLSAENPFLLSVEDPLESTRDCGAASFGILRVQRCMQLAQERIALMAAEWQHTGNINPTAASSQPTAQPPPPPQEESEAEQAGRSSQVDTEADNEDDEEAGSGEQQQPDSSQLSRKERRRLKKGKKEDKRRKREEAKAAAAAQEAKEVEDKRQQEEERMQLGPILTQLSTTDMYVTPAFRQVEEERKLQFNSSSSNGKASKAEQQRADKKTTRSEEDTARQPPARTDSTSDKDDNKDSGPANAKHDKDDEGRKDRKEEKKKKKKRKGGESERLTKKQRRKLREAQAHERNVLRAGNATAAEQSKDSAPYEHVNGNREQQRDNGKQEKKGQKAQPSPSVL